MIVLGRTHLRLSALFEFLSWSLLFCRARWFSCGGWVGGRFLELAGSSVEAVLVVRFVELARSNVEAVLVVGTSSFAGSRSKIGLVVEEKFRAKERGAEIYVRLGSTFSRAASRKKLRWIGVSNHLRLIHRYAQLNDVLLGFDDARRELFPHSPVATYLVSASSLCVTAVEELYTCIDAQANLSAVG